MINGNRAIKISDEHKDLQENPNINLRIMVNLEDVNNPFIWKVTLIGPPDTPYNGGLFILSIQFPDN